MSHNNNNGRSQWGSKIGFLLAAGGSAIGLGNIWRFPTLAGESGGGAFVLIYLLTVVIVGFTIMLAEFTLGRYAQSDVVGSFKKVNRHFGFIGIIGVVTAFFIMGFYPVVGGWSIAYVFKALTGAIHTTDATILNDTFINLITSNISPLIWALVFLILNVIIVWAGIDKGIEKASKILMPSLFIIMIILTIRSLTLDGAMEGVKFFLKPDFNQVMNPKIIMAAVGQAFFSLSLGMGCMVTYGGYLKKEENLLKSAVIVPILDTVVAIMAGLIILPAVFAFGFEPGSGPGLVFITLPAVFTTMGGFGTVFSVLFFLLLAIAALTSSISLLELPVAYFISQRHWNRKKAVLVCSSIMFVMSIFASLSQGMLQSVTILGKNFFDFYDYMSANILLPVGGILLSISTGWVLGKKEIIREATNDGELEFRLGSIWVILLKYVIPVLIFIVLLSQLGLIKL